MLFSKWLIRALLLKGLEPPIAKKAIIGHYGLVNLGALIFALSMSPPLGFVPLVSAVGVTVGMFLISSLYTIRNYCKQWKKLREDREKLRQQWRKR